MTGALWALLMNENLRIWIRPIESFVDGKPLRVQASPGEVRQDRQDMRIPYKRTKRNQTSILRARPSSLNVGHHSRFRFAAEIFGENDCLREIFHGTTQTPALIPQTEIRFLFGQFIAMLQDSLGAFHQFSRLELALHFLGFFHQARVLLRENTTREWRRPSARP